MSDEKKDEANTEPKDIFLDNGDYSWEYYDNGKLVSSDEYADAHASYFTS